MHVFLFLLLGMFVEFWFIVAIAKQIGVFATMGATVLTAIIGLSLVRRQGLQTLAVAQAKAAQGESPAREMMAGLALLFAGVFLFVPGFISDLLGFALLLPGVRSVLGRLLLGPLMAGGGQFQFYQRSQGGKHTFEGEFEREDPGRPDDDKKNQNFLP